MNALPQSRHEKGLTGLARSISLRSENFSVRAETIPRVV